MVVYLLLLIFDFLIVQCDIFYLLCCSSRNQMEYIYCYEFPVTRNHVCLLFEILRGFSRVLCNQNHLTTG